MSQHEIEFCRRAVAMGYLDAKQAAQCLEMKKTNSHSSIMQVLLQSRLMSMEQIQVVMRASQQGGSSQPAPQRTLQIQRYHVLQEIGRGGMGVVYKCMDTQLQRVVALKLLLAGDNSHQEDIDRFMREAKATAKFDHPNIVKVYDIGVENGHPYLAMEYITGKSLKEIIAASTLTVKKTVQMMIKICDALHYVHSQGIVHRDLKPANIMVDDKGEPRIMDFGLAKTAESSKKLSRTGALLGTILYMPPEQAQGIHRDVDGRSDIYSLGATLYEILTKRVIFSGKTFQHVLTQILNEEPPSIRKIKPRIPQDLECICFKAIAKKREWRYQTAGEFKEDLIAFANGDVVQASRLNILQSLWRKMLKYSKSPIAISVMIFLISMIILVVSMWKLSGEKRKGIVQKSQETVVKKSRTVSAMDTFFEELRNKMDIVDETQMEKMIANQKKWRDDHVFFYKLASFYFEYAFRSDGGFQRRMQKMEKMIARGKSIRATAQSVLLQNLHDYTREISPSKVNIDKHERSIREILPQERNHGIAQAVHAYNRRQWLHASQFEKNIMRCENIVAVFKSVRAYRPAKKIQITKFRLTYDGKVITPANEFVFIAGENKDKINYSCFTPNGRMLQKVLNRNTLKVESSYDTSTAGGKVKWTRLQMALEAFALLFVTKHYKLGYAIEFPTEADFKLPVVHKNTQNTDTQNFRIQKTKGELFLTYKNKRLSARGEYVFFVAISGKKVVYLCGKDDRSMWEVCYERHSKKRTAQQIFVSNQRNLKMTVSYIEKGFRNFYGKRNFQIIAHKLNKR
ncbi:serine/threonine-protein kinase [Candidatus Uabimicrobium amorphum]|uniref:non-specific serine/threonine protein kinase n=1 Tax=Uabimicrobium amorphum TaxID=2596890 RepID=A0A5S9IMQ6_UABAM|nr:serine/threonine-protein kinase [Candidatus Uabimicrobium amorphum]BBM84172.1 protein kinase [Candidatus Uabimicrobium amorphum]